MTGKKTHQTSPGPERKHPQSSPPPPGSHSRIVAMDDSRGLDTAQLSRLEEAFREWAQDAGRADVRLSRQRILLIFLLIRSTGARLNEVLALHPYRDIDFQRHTVVFWGGADEPARQPREVQIPETLSREIEAILAAAPAFQESLNHLLNVDPAHVRRKFRPRHRLRFCQGAGRPRRHPQIPGRGAHAEQPALPVVQRILGHSSPNLTASFVSFSDDDMQQVTRFFLERESRRQTSARNAFFGKISAIEPGDIQAKVEMVTLGGDRLTTLITTDSLARLGLKPGLLVTAEVKAPMVVLEQAPAEPRCSADNKFPGRVRTLSGGPSPPNTS